MNNLARQIRVDFRSEEPIFMQIARQVQGLVLSGELKVGDQLPTMRELATELRVNFNTVARAYHLLDEARLISTQRGRGTYIWEEPSLEVVEKLRQQSLQEIARIYLSEVTRLGYTPEQALSALRDAIRADSSEIGDEENKT